MSIFTLVTFFLFMMAFSVGRSLSAQDRRCIFLAEAAKWHPVEA